MEEPEVKTNHYILSDQIKNLIKHIGTRDKKRVLLVIFFSLLSAIFELISIGALIPFISVIAYPESIQDSIFLKYIFKFIEFESSAEALLLISLGFIFSIILATLTRIILLAVTLDISVKITRSLGEKIFTNILMMDYSKHADHNSSEIITTIFDKTANVSSYLLTPIMNIISSSIIVMAILALVFTFVTEQAIFISIIFGLIYYLISFLTKKRTKRYGELLNISSGKTIKSLQEAIGGIRDIIIDNNQNFFISIFSKHNSRLRTSAGKVEFIQSYPKFLIEMLGMLVIVAVGFYLAKDNSLNESNIALLGGLALSAQKLLPLFQNIYSGYIRIISFKDQLIAVNYYLGMDPEISSKKHNGESHLKINLSNEIKFSNISFSYEDTKEKIFENLSFSIKKGEKIGIVGATGSGKSTLSDLIMGLLEPNSGDIKVDSIRLSKNNKTKWQQNISHVPQNIFISDGTFIDNIAFGVSEENIDEEMVIYSSKLAKLHDFITSLEDGYKTILGERGSKLSGGQKQRLAIARALYKKSSVLILDEATSALDMTTERSIINEINSQNKTIIMIAHRYTTLQQCDRIFMIENKKISYLDYNELLNLSNPK